jgi:hypothetical protein
MVAWRKFGHQKKSKFSFPLFFVHKSYIGLRYSWSSDYLFGEVINVKCDDFVLVLLLQSYCML